MSAPPRTIRVAIVEDLAEERQSLSLLIGGTHGFACVGVFSSGEEAIDQMPALHPDVILMDIHLPGLSGIETVVEIRRKMAAVRIVMLTIFEDHDRIFNALRSGANGYLLKNTPPSRLLDSIREVHEGGAPMSASIARQIVDWFHVPVKQSAELETLSPREEQILRLLTRGFLYKEIADQLQIGEGTVRTYIGRIYTKLHVHSRAEAMLKTFPGAFNR